MSFCSIKCVFCAVKVETYVRSRICGMRVFVEICRESFGILCLLFVEQGKRLGHVAKTRAVHQTNIVTIAKQSEGDWVSSGAPVAGDAVFLSPRPPTNPKGNSRFPCSAEASPGVTCRREWGCEVDFVGKRIARGGVQGRGPWDDPWLRCG